MICKKEYYAFQNPKLPDLLHDINATVDSSPNIRLIGVCNAVNGFYAVMEEETFIEEDQGGPIASKS